MTAATSRGCVEVFRSAAISIGRRIWRAMNAARLVAGAGASGRKIRLGADVTVINPHMIACGTGVTIGDGAELLALPTGGANRVSIEVGDQVKIGKRCQLAANPGHIRIGAHASMHSGVVLLGDVSIGRYTLLSANIFASSGNHRAFDTPHLLIRDQDLAASREGPEVKPVVVEEDCWVGWGAAIMSGVHIGRGAVIGANAVVTADVEPYDVVVGQPARRLRKRLPFFPVEQILAAKEEHGPYLYRGFLQSKAERDVTAREWTGHVSALRHTVIVVSGESGFSRLHLKGVTLAQNLSLHILFEGGECVIALPEEGGRTFDRVISLSDFRPTATGPNGHDCRVSGARVFRLVAISPRLNVECRASAGSVVWAIHSATLTN